MPSPGPFPFDYPSEPARQAALFEQCYLRYCGEIAATGQIPMSREGIQELARRHPTMDALAVLNLKRVRLQP